MAFGDNLDLSEAKHKCPLLHSLFPFRGHAYVKTSGNVNILTQTMSLEQ